MVAMKTCPAILALLAFAIPLSAQETNAPLPPQTAGATVRKIGPAEATNYYDQVMIVTGRVAQVTIRPNANFLNLDKPYPNSPFTIVIFPQQRELFGDLNVFRGKSIEIKGRIRSYRDKPEIVLDNTNQLTVLGVSSLELLLKPKIESTPTNTPPSAPLTNFPEIM
jgi:hypothetical protein